jgi:hypothetical protein
MYGELLILLFMILIAATIFLLSKNRSKFDPLAPFHIIEGVNDYFGYITPDTQLPFEVYLPTGLYNALELTYILNESLNDVDPNNWTIDVDNNIINLSYNGYYSRCNNKANSSVYTLLGLKAPSPGNCFEKWINHERSSF